MSKTNRAGDGDYILDPILFGRREQIAELRARCAAIEQEEEPACEADTDDDAPVRTERVCIGHFIAVRLRGRDAGDEYLESFVRGKAKVCDGKKRAKRFADKRAAYRCAERVEQAGGIVVKCAVISSYRTQPVGSAANDRRRNAPSGRGWIVQLQDGRFVSYESGSCISSSFSKAAAKRYPTLQDAQEAVKRFIALGEQAYGFKRPDMAEPRISRNES